MTPPYIWGEISVSVRCGDDREQAEAIILEATRRPVLDANITGGGGARSLERGLDPQPRGHDRPDRVGRTDGDRGDTSA